MASTKDFKVAIVGGGMCGLLCAIGLSKAGIDVDLFESASKFGEVGAGVAIGANARRALDGIGVLDAVMRRYGEPTQKPFLFLSGLEGHEVIYDYPGILEDGSIGILRSVFLNALVDHFDPKRTYFSKHCTSVAASPGAGTYNLHFADGTSYEADIVIGADGIKSAVRNAVTDVSKHLVFTNTVAYRGLVPTEVLKHVGVKTDLSRQPICFCGPEKHLILFPLKSGQLINIVVFTTDRRVPTGPATPPPWVIAASRNELLEEFRGWGDDVMAILSCLENHSKWLIHGLYPTMDTYTQGNIVLVGDAAHGMLPHLGAGAGQGIEDAYLLCRLLSHPQTTASNTKDVIQAYDVARVPRASMVANRSLEMGNIYETYGVGGCTAADTRDRLTGMWEPVWHYDLEKEYASAVEQLERNGIFV